MTYAAPGGNAKVQDEIDRFDDSGSEHFMARVRYLATAAMHDWNRPQARKLSGYKDLYEIRFRSGRNETRALGFFGPGPMDFTITLIATKKQNVYKPTNALATADARAKQARKGEAVARLQIDGEDFPPVP